MKKLRGAGLLEVLATITILAMSVIALIRFQSYLSYNTTLTRQQAEATALAASELETLRDFQVINNTSGYTSYQSIASGTSTSIGTTTTYNIAWTVASFTDPSYKTITVTVSWTDKNNTAQSISINSRIGSLNPAFSAAIM